MKWSDDNYTTRFGHLAAATPAFSALHRLVMTYGPYLRQLATGMGRKRVTISEALAARKKSDTIFIFGSGASVNNLSREEWAAVSRHNTLSFNWFIYQDFVDIDFHVVRETYAYVKRLADLKAVTMHYAEVLLANPRYYRTVLFVQGGRKAASGNCLVGYRMIPGTMQIVRFSTKSRGIYEPPSLNPEEGLVHGTGTLIDSLNLAVLGGWRKIVLVGVDLYDRRYFWLGPNQTNAGRDPHRGVDVPHNTAENGIVEFIAKWNAFLTPRGGQIFTYNPASLLAKAIPVFPAPERRWTHPASQNAE